MADALDLGSSPKGCRFNSCYPHQKRIKRIHKESKSHTQSAFLKRLIENVEYLNLTQSFFPARIKAI